MDSYSRPKRLSLFSGIGGDSLGGILCGFRTVCYVEIDSYCQRILKARIKDGCLDDAPIWDNVVDFNGKPFQGVVDVITGGDPCQNASNARRGGGATPRAFGGDFIRIVKEVQPKIVLRENPAAIRKDAEWPSDRFASELERLGYTTSIVEIRTCCLGGDHRRARLFVLAALPNTSGQRLERHIVSKVEDANSGRQNAYTPRSDWRSATPGVLRAPNGFPSRMDRVRTCGNAQSSIVAATAWSVLTEGLVLENT